jgi:hypothetical protein
MPPEVSATPDVSAMVPVTDAVTVEATVVTDIVPTPVCKLTHSAKSVQKAPPQTKDSVPQQSSGTANVSPVERVSIPGFALARQVALRKSSVATWSREFAAIDISCPHAKLKSSTAAAVARRIRWGIGAGEKKPQIGIKCSEEQKRHRCAENNSSWLSMFGSVCGLMPVTCLSHLRILIQTPICW